MTAIITNGNAFPLTSINVNDNLMNIALGDKVLIDAGIINTVILGNWNRLIAGISNVIQMGTKMNATFANTINLTYGNTRHYSTQDNQTRSDNDVKYALTRYSLIGGTASSEQQLFMQENNRVYIILAGTIISFFLLIGISLFDIQASPFKTINNNNNSPTTDPSTGEIINNSGSGIVMDTSIMAISSTITQIVGLIVIMIGQSILAKNNPISKLDLKHNSLLAQVINNTTNRDNQLISGAQWWGIKSNMLLLLHADHQNSIPFSTAKTAKGLTDKSYLSITPNSVNLDTSMQQGSNLDSSFINISNDEKENASILIQYNNNTDSMPNMGIAQIKTHSITFLCTRNGTLQINCKNENDTLNNTSLKVENKTVSISTRNVSTAVQTNPQGITFISNGSHIAHFGDTINIWNDFSFNDTINFAEMQVLDNQTATHSSSSSDIQPPSRIELTIAQLRQQIKDIQNESAISKRVSWPDRP